MAAITLQRTARDLTTQARRRSIPQGWGLPAAWQAFTIVTVDFETFFSADYTLKKLNTSDYIRDPRFRAHMASIKVGNTPTRLVLHKDLQKEFAKIDWSRTMLLCHNTSFDGLIMQHHYGVVPAVYLDTLSMARAVHGNAIRADLDTVARFYGRGNKMEDVLMQSRGIENLELPEYKELLLKMGAYCVVDSDLCYAVFHDMLAKLPPEELELIHQTISMFANPVLEINLPLAAEARDEEVARRELLFKKCIPDSDVAEWRENNRSKKDRELTDHQVRAKLLRKDVYFAAVLQEFGVAPPKKYSTKQEKMVVSFSKDLLVALQESIQPDAEDGEELHDLLQARIDANSTITVTRAERLLNLGKNGWKVPVGYNYYRAVTGRWGGANKCLAGNTRIKVLRASGSQHVYLSHLQDDDLVWDGTEYVAHDGLIFQGVRPVLSYGGIIGTPDHKVFVESNNDPVELHVAKQNGWALQKVEESHSQEYHCTSVPAVAVYDILNCGPRNRFSANGKLVSNCNFQNFSRGGKLRKSIQAQRGYQIVVVDSSQIEARTLAWVTGANWKLDVFRKHDIVTGAKHGKTGETLELRGDPDSFILNLQAKDEKWEPTRAGPDNYRVAYATSFKVPVEQVSKDQRQIGKVQDLALGYQGAVGAFNSMARNYGMKLPENEVKRVVHAWRRANKEAVAFWATCEDVLRKLCKGLSGRFGRDNVLEYGVWGNTPQVKLPNGMTLKYPGLKCELSVDKYGRERMRCSYITTEGPKDIYGGLLCENITQALARIIVGYQSLELSRKFRWVMTVHDEGSFHVPTPKARAFYLEALKVFRTPPSWAPDLPVNGDGGWDRSYCK